MSTKHNQQYRSIKQAQAALCALDVMVRLTTFRKQTLPKVDIPLYRRLMHDLSHQLSDVFSTDDPKWAIIEMFRTYYDPDEALRRGMIQGLEAIEPMCRWTCHGTHKGVKVPYLCKQHQRKPPCRSCKAKWAKERMREAVGLP